MSVTPGQEEAEGHVLNPTAIRVLSVGKPLKIEPFKIPKSPLEVGRTWREWIEDFEDETSYFEITEIRDCVNALKIYGGKGIKKLARNLPETAPVVGDDDNKKLKRKINIHFLPKRNKHHARCKFNKQKQIAGESVVTYSARLREKSKDCEFGEQRHDRILEHLIQTIKDSELVKRSIQKKWNLDQFLEEASQREDINQQVKDMKEDFKISKVGHESEDFPPRSGKWGRRRNSKKKLPRPPGKRQNKKEEKKKGKSCGYCGKTGPHPPGRNCPAYGQQCLKCGKYNHHASCCRIGAQPQEESKETRRERVKKTIEVEETSSKSDDDYIYLQETAQHLHPVKKIRSGPNQDTVLIRIGDIDAFVEPDSGASANVMDEYQFKALKHRSQEIKELKPSRDTLKTFQSKLTVKGEFTATLRNKNRGIQSKFLVIQGKMDSPPLLSKSTLLKLKNSDGEAITCCSLVQGWRSGESTRLPPMWPRLDSSTRHHMWVEFVGSLLCTKRFSPGTPVSPFLKNQHLTCCVNC